MDDTASDGWVASSLAYLTGTCTDMPWTDATSERTEPMSTWGTVNDYSTGSVIREATAAEWRKTAEAISIHPVGDVAEIEPGPDEISAWRASLDGKGRWQDAGGRLVYVDGGPDPLVTEYTIRDLRREAAAAGDLAMVGLCDRGRGDDDDAFRECVRVILDTRMETAADAEISEERQP